MGLILLIVVLVLLFGVTPGIGPIPHNYGYGAPGLVGVVLIVLVVLMLIGRL